MGVRGLVCLKCFFMIYVFLHVPVFILHAQQNCWRAWVYVLVCLSELAWNMCVRVSIYKIQMPVLNMGFAYVIKKKKN